MSDYKQPSLILMLGSISTHLSSELIFLGEHPPAIKLIAPTDKGQALFTFTKTDNYLLTKEMEELCDKKKAELPRVYNLSDVSVIEETKTKWGESVCLTKF